MKTKKILIFVLFTFASLTIGMLIFGYYVYDSTINFIYTNSSKEKIEIKEGQTLFGILPELEKRGFIKNSEIIKLYLKISNVELPKLKVGTYELPEKFNFNELLEIISKGGLLKGIRITIKEGLRIEETAEAISKNIPNFNKQKFIDIAKTEWINLVDENIRNKILEIQNNKATTLEGFLFPDTYEVLENWNELDIIQLLLRTFLEKTENLRNSAIYNEQIKNFYEGLILASIIEKEASSKDDKREIASVFYNRLKINMILQSDATVNYITGKKNPGILISDQKIDSPYNTYKYTGLPPTPIASPGIKSIEASLTPASTPYYFFFHDDEGNAYYSITYAEHNQKLIKIRGKI